MQLASEQIIGILVVNNPLSVASMKEFEF